MSPFLRVDKLPVRAGSGRRYCYSFVVFRFLLLPAVPNREGDECGFWPGWWLMICVWGSTDGEDGLLLLFAGGKVPDEGGRAVVGRSVARAFLLLPVLLPASVGRAAVFLPACSLLFLCRLLPPPFFLAFLLFFFFFFLLLLFPFCSAPLVSCSALELDQQNQQAITQTNTHSTNIHNIQCCPTVISLLELSTSSS